MDLVLQIMAFDVDDVDVLLSQFVMFLILFPEVSDEFKVMPDFLFMIPLKCWMKC